jgi:hypothetical protein
MIIMSEKEEFRPGPEDAHYFLDIRKEVGQFTFGHTKLLIERPKPREIAKIRLNGGDPSENVPPRVAKQGGPVIAPGTEDANRGDGLHRLGSRSANLAAGEP